MRNSISLAAAACLMFMLAGCQEPPGQQQAERGVDDQVVAAGEIDAFAMKVGDCFQDQSDGEITEVPGVPCDVPHDNEVFATFEVQLAAFPGDDEITEMALEECVDRFEGYVGLDYPSSILAVFPITPTDASWREFDDREVICALYDMNGEKLVGSMRNSGI